MEERKTMPSKSQSSDARVGTATRPFLPSRSESLWTASRPFPRYPPLQGPLAVDVAIVGGGITGLTVAALLRAVGKKVAVVEALRIADGVTGHTSAHLTEVVDCSFRTLLSH